MLQAFQMQLNALAADHDGKFEKKIKERRGSDVSQGYVEEMKQFIQLLPKIERRIFSLYVWLPENSKVKEAGSHFLAYMYQPDDFIPEDDNNGLFGYIDDAYIAALFFELMVEEIADYQEYRLRKDDKDLLRKAIKLRKKAKAIIPDEADKIKEMLAELFEGDETIFQELFENKNLHSEDNNGGVVC